MGSRTTNLRTKVVALLASLVALWAFAAWVTLRDGINLLGVQTLNSRVYEPSEPLQLQLEAERRLSLSYLGRPSEQQREQLAAERRRTDQFAAEFRVSTEGWQTKIAAGGELEQRVADVLTGLERLTATRTAIDNRSTDRAATFDAFGDVIESVFQVYEALGSLDDREIAEDTAALTELNRARELLSQEDALLAGILAAERMTVAERAQLAQLVGAQRITANRIATRLPAADRNRYEEMVGGDAFSRLRALEDRLIQSGEADARPAVTVQEWDAASEPALAQMWKVVVTGGDDVLTRATPVAIGVVLRMVLAAGLGLLAVIASIIVSITTARALVRQLERLREAAEQLARQRLPGVVERLGRGEEVDVAAEAPPLEFGNDEIGQVGQAFNAVQETAIRTAVEQAELRRNVRDVFLSLARRTQALVHRQLTLLDAMERRENDAEELEDLFRVDHLATRMRRNAENLIVLSGSTPGRAWRRNVPLVDVVRGAVAEVEDYTRVNVLPLGSVSLAGRAVGDVIHLLAELIENGLSFSPPHTAVEVRGQMVSNGFAIEIVDRGLGMSEEDLAAANARIVDRSELNLANATRLGLYVVSRLTERHGVRVHLRDSPFGGITAVVLIPLALVTVEAEDPERSGEIPGGGTEPPATPSGATEAGPGAPWPPRRSTPPVALVDTPLPVRPDRAPAADTVPEVDAPLPTRTRLRPAGAPSTDRPGSEPSPEPVRSMPPAQEQPGGSGLPTRPRRTSENPALDGPTYPIGLPVTRPPAERAAPETGGPAPATVEPAKTESGLPVRVRQANLAPELREETAAQESAAEEEDTVRPPEQVRRMMSSYQSGTRRGRTEAARMLGEPPTGDDTGASGESDGRQTT